MVLSNAERQKRFRERLKAAARGDDLGERASALIEAALEAVWSIHHRDENMGGLEDFADVAALKAWIADPKNAKGNGSAVEQLSGFFAAYINDGTPDEKALLARASTLLDAVMLSKYAPVKARRGRSSNP